MKVWRKVYRRLAIVLQRCSYIFNESKNFCSYDGVQDMVLFNTKETGGKPVFIREWFDSNILSIQDLLNSNGQLPSFQGFKNKYACKMNFLQFYDLSSYQYNSKIFSNQSKNTEHDNELYTGNNFLFQL